jgi:DNA-binding NarL/FixJ family response regulator
MAILHERETTIHVFVADAAHMGCQLMASALRRSRCRIHVTGCATDSVAVRSAFIKPGGPIDVAVISSHLRDGALAGLRVIAELRASHPDTRTIVLLDSSERVVVVEAFRSGARGIFTREQPFELLCKSIQAVYEGEVWASNAELQFALDALAQTEVTNTDPAKGHGGRIVLSKREEGVVHLVAEGLTNRDISRQLNLSENTVRNYLFRIFNKIGTSNRLELALYAINRKQTHQLEQREPREKAAQSALSA